MASQHVLTLTDASFAEAVTKSPLLLVDFWAPWCGPCKMLGPIIDEIAEELAGKATIAKVNVDDSPSIAAEHRISAIPTIMIFREGKLVERLTGMTSKAILLEKLQ